MLHLILGGASSGKSEYAEALALSEKPEYPHFYVATMFSEGKEAQERIRRHRALRSGKGFLTLEQPVNLSDRNIPEGSVILLECLGNLAANELFDSGAGQAMAEERILSGIRLLRRSRDVFVVSDDVFSEGAVYGEGTEKFLELLGRLNIALAREADNVTEITAGIPVVWKGRKH